MEEKEANDLMNLLGIQEDDDGLIKYMGKNQLSCSFNEWKGLRYLYIFSYGSEQVEIIFKVMKSKVNQQL